MVRTSSAPKRSIAAGFEHKTFTQKNNESVLRYRDKKFFRLRSFCNKIESNLAHFAKIHLPLNTDNFNSLLDIFVNIISETIEKHALVRRLSRKQPKLVKKPLDYKRYLIINSKKNSMFRSHFINGDNLQKHFFRPYLNKLTKIKTLSKKLFYHKELKKSKNDRHKTWETIRTELSIKPNCNPSASLTFNDSSIDNPCTIYLVVIFNNFFCTIGSNLAERVKTKQNLQP